MTKKEPPEKIKVFIVDDHPIVREGLKERIGREPNMEVCGEAADGHTALKMIGTQRPDVAVIDIGLKKSDGIDLTQRLKARGDAVRMLIWSMYSESHYAERALRAGALGFITKDQPTEQVIRGIEQVYQGKIFLSESMQERLVCRGIGSPHDHEQKDEVIEIGNFSKLTNRELEVFRLIGQAMDTRSIANCLHLSPKTVETYQARIKEKLKLSGIRELVTALPAGRAKLPVRLLPECIGVPPIFSVMLLPLPFDSEHEKWSHRLLRASSFNQNQGELSAANCWDYPSIGFSIGFWPGTENCRTRYHHECGRRSGHRHRRRHCRHGLCLLSFTGRLAGHHPRQRQVRPGLLARQLRLRVPQPCAAAGRAGGGRHGLSLSVPARLPASASSRASIRGCGNGSSASPAAAIAQDMLQAGHAIQALLNSSRGCIDELLRNRADRLRMADARAAVCLPKPAGDGALRRDRSAAQRAVRHAPRSATIGDALTELEPALKPGLAGGWLYRRRRPPAARSLDDVWRAGAGSRGVAIREKLRGRGLSSPRAGRAARRWHRTGGTCRPRRSWWRPGPGRRC